MSDFQDTYEITAAERVGKGVTGLPDTPGLSTGDMQTRFDSLANLSIDKFNALIEAFGDVITNDGTKVPTMKAIVAYVSAMGGGDMTKAVYDTDDDGVVDNSEQLAGHGPEYYRNQYVITCPTAGYTDESVTIGGITKSVKSIIITSDKDGNPLTNFADDMVADRVINLTGTIADYCKLYALEIANGKVTLYFTAAPTTAFNVLIKEAV